MSDVKNKLLAIYVDGETKTGKGAASQAIADTLKGLNLTVYYDVAGDFYRRYVAMVRRELALEETAPLPTTPLFETVATKLYDTKRAFEVDGTLGDLQRAAISTSVSVLGELSIAQKAGSEWYAASVEQAVAAHADVMVLDGRNPRERVAEQQFSDDIELQTVLDLYMTCSPDEAARRILLANGTTAPTANQIEDQALAVSDRRKRDRERSENPFLSPIYSVVFKPGEYTAEEVVRQSWQTHADSLLPVAITLDNTAISKTDMLTAVNALTAQAVHFLNI